MLALGRAWQIIARELRKIHSFIKAMDTT